MTNVILWLIAISTVITSIINVAKPAYKKFAWKFTVSINVLLSFALWVLASFSTASILWLELNTWSLILLWLALGTWSNIFYDIWSLLQSGVARLKKDLID